MAIGQKNNHPNRSSEPIRQASTEPKKKPMTVKVGRETAGRGGKGVTTIFDVPLNESALKELAAKLKQRCGTGGTVKNGRIEIQGDQRETHHCRVGKAGFQSEAGRGLKNGQTRRPQTLRALLLERPSQLGINPWCDPLGTLASRQHGPIPSMETEHLLSPVLDLLGNVAGVRVGRRPGPMRLDLGSGDRPNQFRYPLFLGSRSTCHPP